MVCFMSKKRGVIKNFMSDKGYGFIECGKFDIFFHLNNSHMIDEKSLLPGVSVLYNTKKDQKGRTQAIDLEIA
jgi:cold shock CspA family protein